MRCNSLLFMFFAAAVFCFLPSIGSGAVTWSPGTVYEDVYQWAEAYGDGYYGYDSDYDDGPLPLSGSAQIANPADTLSAYAESSISETGFGNEMYVTANSWSDLVTSGNNARSEANTEFQGEFYSTNSLLEFNYSYSYDIYAEGFDSSSWAGDFLEVSLSVGTVDNGEGSPEELYSSTFIDYGFTTSGINNNSDSGTGSGTIYIPIPVGTDIFVSLSAMEEVWSENNSAAGANSLTLSYDFTVVPEPISSTLFIIGGATMSFRLYRKKKETV